MLSAFSFFKKRVIHLSSPQEKQKQNNTQNREGNFTVCAARKATNLDVLTVTQTHTLLSAQEAGGHFCTSLHAVPIEGRLFTSFFSF